MSSAMVYHGTDSASTASIVRRGLNNRARRRAAGLAGVDDKGFSVTTDRAIAAAWAKAPAAHACRTDLKSVPLYLLRQPSLADLGDPGESFIDPADFRSVGPAVFQPVPDA
jgi:hypothetical protein